MKTKIPRFQHRRNQDIDDAMTDTQFRGRIEQAIWQVIMRHTAVCLGCEPIRDYVRNRRSVMSFVDERGVPIEILNSFYVRN